MATTIAKTNGLALILYEGIERNLAANDTDPVRLEHTEVMELYIDRVKWNSEIDATKRDTETIRISLINLLHGAAIQPAELPCFEQLAWRSSRPAFDTTYEIWVLEFVRLFTDIRRLTS